MTYIRYLESAGLFGVEKPVLISKSNHGRFGNINPKLSCSLRGKPKFSEVKQGKIMRLKQNNHC